VAGPWPSTRGANINSVPHELTQLVAIASKHVQDRNPARLQASQRADLPTSAWRCAIAWKHASAGNVIEIEQLVAASRLLLPKSRRPDLSNLHRLLACTVAQIRAPARPGSGRRGGLAKTRRRYLLSPWRGLGLRLAEEQGPAHGASCFRVSSVARARQEPLERPASVRQPER
jgi:hypothetical protein